MLKERVVLSGHTGWIMSVAFNPNSTALASGSWDHSIRVWDVNTSHEITTLKSPRPYVRTVAFSPDGTTLASGSGYDADRAGALTLWDIATSRERMTFDIPGGARTIAFADDGKLVVSDGAQRDHAVVLSDAATGKEVSRLIGHINDVLSVAVTIDGRLIASGSGDGVVMLWHVATGTVLLALQGHMGNVYTVAFNQDGTMLAAGGENGIVVWRLPNGNEVWRLATDREQSTRGDLLYHQILSLAFSSDGEVLAGGTGDDSEQEGSVVLWKAATGQVLDIWIGDAVYAIAASQRSGLLASGGADERVRVWQLID